MVRRCLIQDLPSGESQLLCPLVAGDLTRLYPPSGSHGHLSKQAILKSSGLKQVTPSHLRLLMVAPCLQVLESSPQFIHPSFNHSQSPIRATLSLFHFGLQPFSPHIVSGLYSMSFMNSARDKNAMLILSELGDTHSQVCWAAGCKKEVQGSGG